MQSAQLVQAPLNQVVPADQTSSGMIHNQVPAIPANNIQGAAANVMASLPTLPPQFAAVQAGNAAGQNQALAQQPVSPNLPPQFAAVATGQTVHAAANIAAPSQPQQVYQQQQQQQQLQQQPVASAVPYPQYQGQLAANTAPVAQWNTLQVAQPLNGATQTGYMDPAIAGGTVANLDPTAAGAGSVPGTTGIGAPGMNPAAYPMVNPMGPGRPFVPGKA